MSMNDPMRVFCPKHDEHEARYTNGRPELDDQCPRCVINAQDIAARQQLAELQRQVDAAMTGLAAVRERYNQIDAEREQQLAEMRGALQRAEQEILADKGGRVWTCLQVIRAALAPTSQPQMKCADCGAEWPRTDRDQDGDVCQKCFADFNGMTEEELFGPGCAQPERQGADELIAELRAISNASLPYSIRGPVDRAIAALGENWWIPVSEKHAPLYKDVLVQDQNGHPSIGRYMGHGTYTHERYPVLGQCKAVAWRELPDAYAPPVSGGK